MSLYSRKLPDPELFRNKISQKLCVILKNKQLSINLEKGIYNYSLQEAENKNIVKKWENINFVNLYLEKLKTIYINLNNKELFEKITNKNFKIHELAFMNHQELNPKMWKELIEAKIKRDKNLTEIDMSAATD